MQRYCENCEENVTEEARGKDRFICSHCGYPEEDIYKIANDIKEKKMNGDNLRQIETITNLLMKDYTLREQEFLTEILNECIQKIRKVDEVEK